MAKQTPGPWRYIKSGRNNLWHIEREENGAPVCSIPKGGSEPNARLIAAAPDLLAAIKAMVEHYGDHDDDFSAEARAQARAALAKAEGA